MGINESYDFEVNWCEAIPKVSDVWSLPDGYRFIFLDKGIYKIVFDSEKHMPVMVIETVILEQLEAVRNKAGVYSWEKKALKKFTR